MKKVALCLALVAIVVTGCGRAAKESDVDAAAIPASNSAIKVISVVKMIENNQPGLRAHIRNSGIVIARNLSCSINVSVNGATLEVLDATIGLLENGPDLGIGESTEITAVFQSISEHLDYEKLDFDFTWYEDYSGNVTHELRIGSATQN